MAGPIGGGSSLPPLVQGVPARTPQSRPGCCHLFRWLSGEGQDAAYPRISEKAGRSNRLSRGWPDVAMSRSYGGVSVPKVSRRSLRTTDIRYGWREAQPRRRGGRSRRLSGTLPRGRAWSRSWTSAQSSPERPVAGSREVGRLRCGRHLASLPSCRSLLRFSGAPSIGDLASRSRAKWPSPARVRIVFGSWNAALAAAGLPLNVIDRAPTRAWSDDEILRESKRRRSPVIGGRGRFAKAGDAPRWRRSA